MAKTDDSLSSDEINYNENGVILGVWDQEKTPELIQDLENLVNRIETKCKDLVRQLTYYRKYLEEIDSSNLHVLLFPLKESALKRDKKDHLQSGSDTEITFRKNLYKIEELEDIFKENFERELNKINKKINEAADKIGITNNCFLLPAEQYLENLNQPTIEEAKASWPSSREKFLKIKCARAQVKSDFAIYKSWNQDAEISKITQTELNLYKKLSKLSMKKKKLMQKIKKSTKCAKRLSKLRSRKEKRTFNNKTKEKKIEKDIENVKSEGKINKIKKKRPMKLRNTSSKGIRSYSRGSSYSTQEENPPQINLNRSQLSDIDKICSSLTQGINKKNLEKIDNPKSIINDPSTLASIVRNVVPFTAGTSTTKSFNLGLNIQQFLSKGKYAKSKTKRNNAPANETPEIQPQDVEYNHINSKSKAHQSHQDFSTSYPWTQMRKNSLESNLVPKEKLFVTEHESRKYRSKYTKSNPDGFVEYHKSTTRRYTNGDKSVIKSESKRAYAVGSKIMVSDCQRTHYYELDKDNQYYGNASGDGNCDDQCARLRIEWSKFENGIPESNTIQEFESSQLCSLPEKDNSEHLRKYASLKQQINDSNLSTSEADIETLRKEIDNAIEKYKEFLNFYSKFLHLKHRLKTLKIACAPVTSFSFNCQRKVESFRPTYSMAIKETFRQVQALQEKIKLIDKF